MAIPEIHVDVETASACNLKKFGAVIYSEHPSTRMLCLSYQVHEEHHVCKWFPGDPVPDAFRRSWNLIAHNAMFETFIFRNVLSQIGFRYPDSVFCTMNAAYLYGLPGASLDAVASFLGLENRKDAEGKALMMRLCNIGPKWEEPTPADLARLSDYCDQDVRVEAEVYDKLPVSEFERRVMDVDSKINHAGVLLDTKTIRGIIRVTDRINTQKQRALYHITRGDINTAGQDVAICKWLDERCGVYLPNLQAETVEEALSGGVENDTARQVLEIRRDTALASLKKYPAMLAAASADQRARGMFAYCGAKASGRWSSRRVQLHNFARLPDDVDDETVEQFVEIFGHEPEDVIRAYETAEADASDLLRAGKTLLRPMIIGDGGLVVGDWSKIELCIQGWLANDRTLLSILTQGIDPYVSMAASIYRIEESDVDPGVQRQLGKAAVLGCGYGLGANTFFKRNEKAVPGLTIEMADTAVAAFRSKFKNIPKLWYALSDAIKRVWQTGIPESIGRLTLGKRGQAIGMKLPSGRIIWYHRTRMAEGRFGMEIVCQDPESHGTKTLHGAQLFQHACQAIGRDILAETLVRGWDEGFRIVAHTHDEVIVEGTQDATAVEKLMERVPDWAAGLPLKAKCFACERYTK